MIQWLEETSPPQLAPHHRGLGLTEGSTLLRDHPGLTRGHMAGDPWAVAAAAGAWACDSALLRTALYVSICLVVISGGDLCSVAQLSCQAQGDAEMKVLDGWCSGQPAGGASQRHQPLHSTIHCTASDSVHQHCDIRQGASLQSASGQQLLQHSIPWPGNPLPSASGRV